MGLPKNVADFLQKEYRKNELVQPGDLTARAAADHWGVSDKTAGDRLRGMYNSGKLTRVKKSYPTGQTTWVYSPKE